MDKEDMKVAVNDPRVTEIAGRMFDIRNEQLGLLPIPYTRLLAMAGGVDLLDEESSAAALRVLSTSYGHRIRGHRNIPWIVSGNSGLQLLHKDLLMLRDALFAYEFGFLNNGISYRKAKLALGSHHNQKISALCDELGIYVDDESNIFWSDPRPGRILGKAYRTAEEIIDRFAPQDIETLMYWMDQEGWIVPELNRWCGILLMGEDCGDSTEAQLRERVRRWTGGYSTRLKRPHYGSSERERKAHRKRGV